MSSQLPRLRVSADNPHLLEAEPGRPFFLLGDTAWEALHRLTLDEIALYLANRRDKGFNVVLMNALAEFDGLNSPNALGLRPLDNNDPTKPNTAYFDFVATVAEMAAEQGIYLGLLPTWGDKITAPWGDGPRIFTLDNLPDAGFYGTWLGTRFREQTNILWVLGGDRPASMAGLENEFLQRLAAESGFTPTTDWTRIWRGMANGLKHGTNGNALIAYHPQGGRQSSSHYLHNEDWLNVNMLQSGHGAGHDTPVWERIEHDYNLTPVKPTLDSEPNYEDHPVNPWPTYDPANGYFRDDDVRRQCWRSVFAGGCGVVYGHHSIWQFWNPHCEKINYADRYWTDALDRPGAFHVGHLRRFMEAQPMASLIPDQSLIVSEIGTRGDHVRAMRSEDGTTALVYLPAEKPVEVLLEKLTGESLFAQWFDPRTEAYQPIGPVARTATQTFMPPAAETDWVLVLK